MDQLNEHDLLVHQVMQLHDVGITDCDFLAETLSVSPSWARLGQSDLTPQISHSVNIILVAHKHGG